MQKGKDLLGLKLRRVKEQDQDFLRHVCLSVHKLYAPFMGDAFVRQANKYEDALPSGYRIDVIEQEGKPVGFVGYKRKTSDVMYIVAFYLLEDYYGKGYGQETMLLLEEAFKIEGIQKVFLEVHHKAVWARQFYTKLGFIRALGMDDYKNDLREKETLLLYKELSQLEDDQLKDVTLCVSS